MTKRELRIENYESTLSDLEDYPPTHRYHKEIYRTLIKGVLPSNGLSEADKQLCLTKFKLLIQKLKNMTDEEFRNSNCAGGFCLEFHDPEYPEILRDNIKGKNGRYRIIKVVTEDNIDGSYKERLLQNINGEWIDRGVLE